MKRILTPIIVYIFVVSCKSTFNPKWTEKQAPEEFKARFETTKGNFDILAKRSWSPEGVDRLYQLIESDFYTDIAIYRVVPDFVAQFGIHNDSALNNAWDDYKLPDEPVIKENFRGTVSFARGGPQTRGTQLFINLKSNSPRLDNLMAAGVKGYPGIAEVIDGMDVVDAFFDGYAETPGRQQDSISIRGNEYLKRNFPKLDYIEKAYVIK